MLRVNELLKREVSLLFERLICSRVPSCLVTVTEIRTAPDLRTAIVFVSVYGTPEQKEEVMELVRHERKEIQHQIGRSIKLKYTPKLDFRLDEQLAKADQMYQLLDKLESEEKKSDDK